MEVWHLTIPIPVELIFWLTLGYFVVGLVLVIPLDYWAWRLQKMRGDWDDDTYIESVRQFKDPWYRVRIAVLMWPGLVWFLPQETRMIRRVLKRDNMADHIKPVEIEGED